MSFTHRRVIVVTSRIHPPIRNMQWRAVLGRSAHDGPFGFGMDAFGLGATEAEAVRDLYEEIVFREAKAEEEEGTEI